MEAKTYFFVFFLLISVLLSTASLSSIAHAEYQMTILNTFVLSNESPGYLISTLVNAGLGNDNLYQTVGSLTEGPSFIDIFPSSFWNDLANCPAASEAFTTPLKTFNVPGEAVGISNDGTVQVMSIYGSDYQNAGSKIDGSGSIESSGTINTEVVYNLEHPPTWGTYLIFAIMWGPIAPSSSPTPLPSPTLPSVQEPSPSPSPLPTPSSSPSPSPTASPTPSPTTQPTASPSPNPTVQPQTGFLGTRLPMDYGCAIVASVITIAIMSSMLPVLKRRRHPSHSSTQKILTNALRPQKFNSRIASWINGNMRIQRR